MRRVVHCAVLLVAGMLSAPDAVGARQQSPSTVEAIHRPLDQILDLYVRDGLVYYKALKSERGRLDRYVSSLNVPAATYDGWSRGQQMAFWVNAYNAFVLRTVIDHYPIRGRAPVLEALASAPEAERAVVVMSYAPDERGAPPTTMRRALE